MYNDFFMAGVGGQGILLIGNLLAFAAIREGLNATYFPAYGVEKRGGTATCTVVVSDEEVGSPVVGRPETMLLLDPISVEKYFSRVRPGGLCLINTSLTDNPANRCDIEILRLPLNEMALEAGDSRLVNMVALGACLERRPVVQSGSLASALAEVLPERNHRFIPFNLRALELGAAAAGR